MWRGLIVILFLFSSCRNKELERNILNIDTWVWSKSSTIKGTTIGILETNEISFKSNTFSMLTKSGSDTILFKKQNIEWEIEDTYFIKYKLEGEEFYSELEITEFHPFSINIKGLLPNGRTSIFIPKNSTFN